MITHNNLLTITDEDTTARRVDMLKVLMSHITVLEPDGEIWSGLEFKGVRVEWSVYGYARNEYVLSFSTRRLRRYKRFMVGKAVPLKELKKKFEEVLNDYSDRYETECLQRDGVSLMREALDLKNASCHYTYGGYFNIQIDIPPDLELAAKVGDALRELIQ